jgi:hypothetical protein
MKIKASRNYHADYFVDDKCIISENGIKRMYAIEIQDEAGETIEYFSEDSEDKALRRIDLINTNQDINL